MNSNSYIQKNTFRDNYDTGRVRWKSVVTFAICYKFFIFVVMISMHFHVTTCKRSQNKTGQQERILSTANGKHFSLTSLISLVYLSFNHEGRRGTTDAVTTSFLHFFPCSPLLLWDLANSRPVHSLMLSSGSHVFLCLPCQGSLTSVTTKRLASSSSSSSSCANFHR